MSLSLPHLCAVLTALLLLFAGRQVGAEGNTLPVHKVPEPSLRRVYLGNSRTLTISAPQQLSQNAHVGNIAFRPGSVESAYTGTTVKGNTATSFVRLIDLKRGEMQSLLSSTGPAKGNASPTSYYLNGWSGDGRYLLVVYAEQTAATDAVPQTSGLVWYSIDVGVTPPKVRRAPLPVSNGVGGGAVGAMMPSPSGTLFAVEGENAGYMSRPVASFAFLYNPKTNSVRRSSLPAWTALMGWKDETHLLLGELTGKTPGFLAHDIVTGKDVPTDYKQPMPALVARAFPNVYLSLSVAKLPVARTKNSTRGFSLWLRAKGAKSKLPLVCLTMSLDNSTIDPVLAPHQSSALWVEHGDLYVSHFAVESATKKDKEAGTIKNP